MRKLMSCHAVVALLGALLGLALGGCAVTLSTSLLASTLAYPVAPSKTRFDAKLALVVSHKLSPECEAGWRSANVNDETIKNYNEAAVNVIAGDIVSSGLFTHVVPASEASDFELKIAAEQLIEGGVVLRIHYELYNSERKLINGRTLSTKMGSSVMTANLKDSLPGAMTMIKESVTADLLGYLKAREAQALKGQMEAIRKANLPELLASSDGSVAIARERNRALVAAKDTQLPEMLRNWKSDELAGLVVKLEQTILDLNHEAEVAKDHAERAAASNASAAAIDEPRGLAISYRERIEVLKPILQAVREELANRNR